MALNVEENFIINNLIPGTVFEFGCGEGDFTRKIADHYDVTGNDIFPPIKDINFKFILGDFGKIDVSGEFDNVVALSSFEHCGLGFKECGWHDYDYHKVIAKKLVEKTRVGGKIIITVPHGPDQVYIYNELGRVGIPGTVENPTCGFREFTASGLLSLFKGCIFEKYELYKLNDAGNYDIVKEIDKYSMNTAKICMLLIRRE